MLGAFKYRCNKLFLLRARAGSPRSIAHRNTDHPTCPGLPWITRSPDLSRLPRPAVDHPMEHGFTLIEMIIVITLVAILTSIAIPAYRMHVLHSREAVLKEDLYSMRTCIDQYTQDKNKAPQNLDDLVSAGYLRAIPKDPITNATDTWQPVSDDSIQQMGQTEPGIVDVHSGSNMVSSEGTAYNTW